MEPVVQPLAAILDLNTDLLRNCCEGLSDADVSRRFADGGNSVAFLAAHLTDARHVLAARLGAPLANPLSPILDIASGIDDIAALPPLEEILEAWDAIAAHLTGVLDRLTADELTRELPHKFPIAAQTPLGMMTFLVQHDSYHVGQVAFLRRQLGHGGMSYKRRPKPAAPLR
jgi:uncharacterized damage-inducible protein DinB